MKISQKQIKELIKKLDEFHVQSDCPRCKKAMYLSDIIFELREYKEGNKVAPLVVATCERCGFTMFFNAIKLGIIQLDKKKK